MNSPEYTIIALTVALTHLALAGYYLFKKGIAGFPGKFLFGYLALSAAWNFLAALQFPPTGQIMGWSLVLLYPLLVLAALLWLFSRAFLQIDQAGKFKWWGIIPALPALGLMASIDFGYLPLTFLPSSISYSTATLVFCFGAGVIGLYLLHAIWLAMRVQRAMQSPRHRNRIQFLLLTLSVAAIGFGLILSRNTMLQEIGPLIHWLASLLLVYLSVSANLPDIRTGVKELLGFIIIVSLTMVIYLGTIYALEKALASTSRSHLKIAFAAAVIITLLYPPLRRARSVSVRRLLFRRQYNTRQIIKAYAQTINNILIMQDLITVSLSFIRKELNIQHGAYFLIQSQDESRYYFSIHPDSHKALPEAFSLKKGTLFAHRLAVEGRSISQYSLDINPQFCNADPLCIQTLKQLNIEQYVPIKRNNDLIAILAVGPFNSGEAYALQDIELLSTLANQTAIALENARLFNNVRQNLEEITRIKTLTDNIFASIESGVITIDTQGQIVVLNQAAYRILNLPPSLQPGSNVNKIFTYLPGTALPALLRDVKNTRRSYHAYEISPKISGRGQVDLTVDLSPILDSGKQFQGTAIVINDYTETKQLQVVQNLFRKYLSPAVVDRLPRNPEELKLGGKRQEVTVLFADIRGFTTYSEDQSPEDLITVLNKYLSIAAEAILAYEGTLDKFMGDAVMAIFNAPLEQPDHPLRAVKAAAAMQRNITEFNKVMGSYAAQLSFGVGIHVGEAVIGNVGTQARMDYTAIGDAVNLAKRIQENTPAGRILLSERAYICVKEYVHAIPHKNLSVKGRHAQEQTYELLNIL